MTHWLVAPGPASELLGEAIAKRLGCGTLGVESTIFPDGEVKLKLSKEVSNESIIIVQSIYPPVDRHLFQLILLAHRLSEEGAKVFAFVPYLAYARQDREFLKGEITSLSVIARLMRSVGIRRLDTIDIHSVKGLGFFSFPSYSLSAVPLLANYFKEKTGLKKPIVISPDAGASSRSEGFADILGAGLIIMKKSRDRFTGEVTIQDDFGSIKDRDVILVDDIISTGGSIEKATLLLKKNGARKIFAACTHPLLIGDALKKITDAGVTEVVGTNTLPGPVSKIDVSSLCAKHISTVCV